MTSCGSPSARRCWPATGRSLGAGAPSLKRAEQAWEDALAAAAAPTAPSADHAGSPRRTERQPPRRQPRRRPPGSLLPLREQVYEALSLLQVPAAPKLIATVHEAFFGATFPTTRVTSLKRDEERSFRTAPFARPYYICAALSADYLAPSRGLLAVSTWPLERRVIGSLSPRVDFLTAAIRVAEAIERIPEPPAAARRLLQRFAASIPGAISPGGGADPAAVSAAAAGRAGRARDADARSPRGGGRAGPRPAPRRAAVRHRHVPRPRGDAADAARRGRPTRPARPTGDVAGKAAGE